MYREKVSFLVGAFQKDSFDFAVLRDFIQAVSLDGVDSYFDWRYRQEKKNSWLLRAKKGSVSFWVFEHFYWLLPIYAAVKKRIKPNAWTFTKENYIKSLWLSFGNDSKPAYRLFLEDFKENIDKYQFVFDLLEDSQSKQIFICLLMARLTGVISYCTQTFDRENCQYFDREIIRKCENEVFVDCGAFTGDTLENCLRLFGKESFQKYYFIEPNLSHINVAQKKFSAHTKIKFINRGLSDVPHQASFHFSDDMMSRVAQDGGAVTRLDTVDNLIDEKVTFLTMDIEGEELLALKGAFRHLTKDRPRLCISVYHHLDDLWKIPLFLNDVLPNSKMYLRHYNLDCADFILYFLPD